MQDESLRCENFIDSLFNIRKQHSNKITMTHININSLRNKFDMLTNSVTEYIDIPWNYNTNWNNMKENALLYVRLSLQVVYC